MKGWKRLGIVFLAFILTLQMTGCENWEEQLYGTANVSPMVEQWRSSVEQYAAEYGIGEYVELLLAMIAQESGGDAERHPDILQSSESMGEAPNTITDPQLSLKQGIQYFAALVESGKKAEVDLNTVIQSYNFGGGYISYIRDNYGGIHSEEAARAYSNKMKEKLGWSGYGDVKYVEHVYSHMYLTTSGDTADHYEAMYAVMKEFEGVPYLFGGESKAGIDCSAMAKKIYEAAGISLPRTAQEQYNSVQHIDESQARAGDLVFFTGTYNAGRYITHVGVYTGNGNFFHAGEDKCQFSSLTGYYKEHFVCFGRK